MICPKIRPTIALKVLLATLCLTPFIHLPICQTQVKRSEWPALTISLPCAARRSPVCARVQGCSAGCLARWRLGEPAPVAPPGGRSADHRLQVLEVRSQAVEPKQPQVFRWLIWTRLLCENSGKEKKKEMERGGGSCDLWLGPEGWDGQRGGRWLGDFVKGNRD